tara:strand:+ start:471 stop:929 length:459 start_codon:yes stop_codon:yes gene_type:complete
MSVQLRKKMFKQSILAMALVIGIGYGCTQKTEEIRPVDNATVSLPQKQFSWPEERKGFWISLTFSKLSWNPAVRQAFLPETLFEVSTCIIETMERRYDLKTFERLNNEGSTTPEFLNEIRGVSQQCSRKGAVEQQRRIMKQKLEQSDPKNML